MSHPYGNIGSSLQPRAIPRARTSKIEPNCSIAMSANALSSPHHTSFPIHRGIIFTMASRQFTVDSAKKKKFVDIFLLMPETRVADDMRSAKFTKEDIANLGMQRLLQRALPGGSIKGLKAYVAGLLLPQPRHNQCPTRLVDDAIVNNVEADIVHVEDSNTPCQFHRQRRAEDNHEARILCSVISS